MLILVLDDEKILLDATRQAIQETVPDAETLSFLLPADALKAVRERAREWILKPLSPERTREKLASLPSASAPAPDKLQVQCFGHFQAYWRGKPLLFGRKQTKELFAFLIDREGATCTAEDIAAALWEDDKDMKAIKHRIRTLLSDLRSVLREIGMEDALIRERRQVAIRRDMVDCDYYRMLAGDSSALNAFHGEYMTEYSWAELSAGRLHFRSLH